MTLVPSIAPWMSDPLMMLPASTSKTKFPCSHLNWYFYPTVISGPFGPAFIEPDFVTAMASSYSAILLSALALILSMS